MSIPDPTAGMTDKEFAAYQAQDKGPTVIALICALSVLSTVFVVARIYTRARILKALHLDDYLAIFSQICGWLCVGLSIAAVKRGNGKHFDLLTLDQKQDAIKWTMAAFLPGIFSFGLPKLAVVALLTRIMNPNKWHRIFLWALSSMCLLILTGCIIILYSQCTPTRSMWDFSITDKTCWDKMIIVRYSIFAGALSAAVDLYLAVYPAFVLAKLQLNLKKKLALSGALGIGSTATVVGIYKCTRIPSLVSPDFSYDTADLVIWTIIEGSTIMIASCIPVLQPFIDAIFGRHSLSSNSYSGYKNYGTSRSGTHKDDLELQSTSTSRHHHSRHHSRHHSHHTKGGNTTISYASHDPAKVDSQESILRLEDGVTKPLPVLQVQPDTSDNSHIMRTDVVTVTYDASGGAEKRPESEGDRPWLY